MPGLIQEDVRKIYTVSEVTNDIKGLLEDSFPAVWVCGEISNFKLAASGHAYFTVKDEGAQLCAVMFRNAGRQLKFALEDGLQVILHGRITVYESRGQYQIIVDYVEPQGLGALQLAFEQLKARLDKEGLFDAQYKKPIPFLPLRVGIITSSKGAALHDMVTILTRRFPNIEIIVNPVKVQGEGAGVEIAEAIHEMNERRDTDVLIVGRGGGSLEDLWAFNEEIVVRAVFDSRIPVISAVGHETDYTLCDLVADLRAPTPSAAAELAVPEKEELLLTIAQHRSGLKYALSQTLKAFKEKIGYAKRQFKDPRRVVGEYRQRLDDYQGRLVKAQEHHLLKQRHHYGQLALKLPAPREILKRLRQSLEYRSQELARNMAERITQKRHAYRECLLSLPDPRTKLRETRLQFDLLVKRLECTSPLAPLKKGYALVSKDGSSIRSVQQFRPGDILSLKMQDGDARIVVIN